MAGTSGKLGNEAFLAKAPADVVDKIRAVPTESKGAHASLPTKPVVIKTARILK